MALEEDFGTLPTHYPNLAEEGGSIPLLTAHGILGGESPHLEKILNGMDLEDLRRLVKGRVIRLLRSRVGEKSELILEGTRSPIFSTEIGLSTRHGRLRLEMDTPQAEQSYRQLPMSQKTPDEPYLDLGIVHCIGYEEAHRIICLAPADPAKRHVEGILRRNPLLARATKGKNPLSTLWRTDADLSTLRAVCDQTALSLNLEVGTTFLFDAQNFVLRQYTPDKAPFSRVYSGVLRVGTQALSSTTTEKHLKEEGPPTSRQEKTRGPKSRTPHSNGPLSKGHSGPPGTEYYGYGYKRTR